MSKKLDDIEKKSDDRLAKIETNILSVSSKLEIMDQEIQSIDTTIASTVKAQVELLEDKIGKTVKSKIQTVEDNFETLLDVNMRKVQSEVDSLKSSVLTKADLEAKFKAFSEKVTEEAKNAPTAGSSTMSDPLSPNSRMRVTVDHLSKEMKEKEDKKNNLIVYNKEEQETNNIDERNKLDKEEILKIITDTLQVRMTSDDIIKVNRLGPKITEKKRPVILTIKDAHQKDKIFSNLSKLRYSNHNNLSFSHDLTKRERDEYKKMVEMAKKKEQESGGKKRFRVRGPPWNLRIMELPNVVQETSSATQKVETKRTAEVSATRTEAGGQTIKQD